MSDPSFPAFPVISLLGCVLALIPFPWHMHAWNSGTCLYMFWSAVACLNLGVNSIVWHDNIIDHAPVWCDVSSRVIVAVAVALPASSLCINRRLYYIASVQTVSVSRAEKKRAILVDLLIGLGIPALQLVCQYVVSGHRYDIFEDIGCYPFTYNTPIAYPLSAVWPPVIGLISAAYCVLTLRAFLRRRAQFNQYLSSSPSLTTNRYFRLMALASVELLCTIPISGYGLYLNLSAGPLRKWISWSDTHFHYSKVDRYPSVLWRLDHNVVVAIELSRWAAPFCAFVFFVFFGFAAEARKNYSVAINAFAGCVGLRPSKGQTQTAVSKGSLPSFVAPPKFLASNPPAYRPTFPTLDSPSEPASSSLDYSPSERSRTEKFRSDSLSDDMESSPVSTSFNSNDTVLFHDCSESIV